MYGLIGKMTAVAGQRDGLAAILIESASHLVRIDFRDTVAPDSVDLVLQLR